MFVIISIVIDAQRRRLKKDAVPSLNLSQGEENDIVLEEQEISEEETDSADEYPSDCFCHEEDHESEPNIANDVEEILKYKNTVDKGVIDFVIEKQNEVINNVMQTDLEMDDKYVQTEKYNFMNLLKSDNNLRAFTGINFCILNALIKGINLIKRKAK